jgi:hypothetical protein
MYLTICFVCKEEAKSGEQHTLHYGGIVCLSCRWKCHETVCLVDDDELK